MLLRGNGWWLVDRGWHGVFLVGGLGGAGWLLKLSGSLVGVWHVVPADYKPHQLHVPLIVHQLHRAANPHIRELQESPVEEL